MRILLSGPRRRTATCIASKGTIIENIVGLGGDGSLGVDQEKDKKEDA